MNAMIIEKDKRYNLMLTITETCNLNCVYCYEENKNHNIMPLSIAQKNIKETFSKLDESNSLVISFHGGEPLTAFPLIKDIANWIWAQEWPCKYKLFATTNATLLTDEMKEWFTQNKDIFVLGFSYDGTDEMQDVNRSNSSKLIDKDFFWKNWPKQSIKMTISKLTVGSLAEGIIDLNEKGFIVNANLAYGTDWNMEESMPVFAKQLTILANYYIEHPQAMPSSLLNMPLPAILDDDAKEKHHCGSGRTMCSVAPDGSLYPCQMFMPSSLDRKSDLQWILEQLEKESLLSEKCRDCYMAAICPTCYGMSYILDKDLSARRDDYCKMMKIRALASSYMFGKMLDTDDCTRYRVFSDAEDGKIKAFKASVASLQKHLQKESFLFEVLA